MSSKSTNVLYDGSFRIVDMNSKKELMFLDTKNSSEMKSVLIGILVRNDDDNDWEFLSCMEFSGGSGEENAIEFVYDYLSSNK